MAVIDIPCSDAFPDAPSMYVVARSVVSLVDSLADVDVAQKEPFRTHFQTLKCVALGIMSDAQNCNIVPF